MAETSIEWTDKVWNPTVGCSRVSPGCGRCYAFALHDKRHAAHKAGKSLPMQYAKPFTELQLMEDRLDDPLHWRKPCRVFVNSVSDLFHEDVPDEFVVKCFAVMLLAQQHTFQVLTKRPERMCRIVRAPNFGECVYDMAFSLSHNWTCGGLMDHVPETDVLPNVWLGTSVEDQQRANERIPYLLRTPAAVRFLSCEPLLASVDLGKVVGEGYAGNEIPLIGCVDCGGTGYAQVDPYTVGCSSCRQHPFAERGTGNGIHWVIVGGESGSGARPCQVEWIRSIVEQCKAAQVACFVKQLGSQPRWSEAEIWAGESDRRIRDRKGGEPSEWPADLRVREFPR